MDNPNYAESVLGYNIRNDANFFSRWFFMYLNPTFSKGAKARSFEVSWSSDFSHHLKDDTVIFELFLNSNFFNEIYNSHFNILSKLEFSS